MQDLFKMFSYLYDFNQINAESTELNSEILSCLFYFVQKMKHRNTSFILKQRENINDNICMISVHYDQIIQIALFLKCLK